MKRRFVLLTATGLSAVTSVVASHVAAHAEDCSSAVQAAFEKQRKLASYRLTSKQQTNNGAVETQRDYVAPDRMYNKIVLPGEPAPLETIAVGRWAWANQGGGWQELQPQFAQSVTFEVGNALGTPVEVKEKFECLGKVTRDGKDFIGYRIATPLTGAKPDDHAVARTVLVDAASGLPVHNFVAEIVGHEPPVLATLYTYPDGLAVEAPLDAIPAGKPQ